MQAGGWEEQHVSTPRGSYLETLQQDVSFIIDSVRQAYGDGLASGFLFCSSGTFRNPVGSKHVPSPGRNSWRLACKGEPQVNLTVKLNQYAFKTNIFSAAEK